MNMKTNEPSTQDDSDSDDAASLTIDEYTDILGEIEDQPVWRMSADKEMDYADGNQLDSDLIRRQQGLGIPPAIEDLIGPAMLSIQGYESTTRTDWRVTPSGGTGGQDVADALNSRLNQAERESKADQACSDAFRAQAGIGIGWVEVSRDGDPFKFPFRCQAIHRNEISWDWQAKCPNLSDARWLRRQKWMRPERVALAFPRHKELIEGLGRSGADWWTQTGTGNIDGGASTGLKNGWASSRGWTIEEARWYSRTNRELCLSEVWYRRWVSVLVLKSPDGRVVEYDEDNEAHALAVATGASTPSRATVSRVRRAYWLGPHLLDDAPSPYTHDHFPYVRFQGFVEDRTGVPYGYIRGMIYQQDALNSGTGKLRWGMSSVQTIYTDGVTDMTDAQLAKAVGRVDSRIKLKADAMARPGARFEISRDYQLTSQHFQMLQDSRAAIERVSAMTAGFMGKQGTATSGLQEQTQVEQSNQALGRMMSNFRAARAQVGELLLAMIIEDMGSAQQNIIIEGDSVREERSVVINKPETDDDGIPYLSNDLQRTRLKVALEDVPSTASYRGQQLNALSEAVKSLPDNHKVAVMPFLISLMDVPFKADVIKAIKAVDQQQTPEQIQQQIDAAVKDALAKSGNDIKARELELRYPAGMDDAKEALIRAQALEVGIKATYSAIQTAGQIVANPAISPVADVVMQGQGYRPPTPLGVDPNLPIPQQVMPVQSVPPVQANTSPGLPPVPQQPASPMTGIETARMDGLAAENGEPADAIESSGSEIIT